MVHAQVPRWDFSKNYDFTWQFCIRNSATLALSYQPSKVVIHLLSDTFDTKVRSTLSFSLSSYINITQRQITERLISFVEMPRKNAEAIEAALARAKIGAQIPSWYPYAVNDYLASRNDTLSKIIPGSGMLSRIRDPIPKLNPKKTPKPPRLTRFQPTAELEPGEQYDELGNVLTSEEADEETKLRDEFHFECCKWLNDNKHLAVSTSPQWKCAVIMLISLSNTDDEDHCRENPHDHHQRKHQALSPTARSCSGN